MLAKGELKPGARLVNRTLARALDVSQTPVREAINRLVTEGLAEFVPGAGAFIRKIHMQDLVQIYDLRQLVEPYAAASAAKNAAEFEVAELLRICEDWRGIVDSLRDKEDHTVTGELLMRWNDDEELFHNLIIGASRNRWLESIVGNLRLLMAAFALQRMNPGLLDMKAASTTLLQHMRIARAIRDRNDTLARELMAAHVQYGRDQVLGRLYDGAAPKPASPDQ